MCVSDTGIVELTGMRFFARHGVLESERINGNEFKVDFRAEFNVAPAAQSDNIDDTVNYALIYNLIKAQMDIPSNLLENVACRILKAVKGHFPQLHGISVKVYKKNPPVDGSVEWSSITVFG